MITAGHCIYEEEELLPASLLFVLLGLHDKRKATEVNRSFFLHIIAFRKEIGVSKVIVHENFTFGELADDVALLRLSKSFCPNNFKVFFYY